jgi:hypothetical protein
MHALSFPPMPALPPTTRYASPFPPSGANEAVALARLGLRPSLVGVVGADEHARWLLGRFRADGVDTGGVRAMRQYRDGRVASTGTAVQVVMCTLRSGDKVRLKKKRMWHKDKRDGAQNRTAWAQKNRGQAHKQKDVAQNKRGGAQNRMMGAKAKEWGPTPKNAPPFPKEDGAHSKRMEPKTK